MKFSDYFHARGVRSSSLFYGSVIGILISIFSSWQYGLLAGAVSALILSFLLPFLLYRQDLPYARIKKNMGVSFLIDERVYFTVQGGMVGGFFLLTQSSMVFLSLEKGEHRLELTRKDVKSVILGDNMTISIFLNDKQFVRIISRNCEGICDILQQNGWTVSN